MVVRANDSAEANHTYKVADTEEEFEQIFQLNYQTFVEEIPQHSENTERRLVDKFHEENTYLICLKGDALLGMMALRDQRPFSLDTKLDDLDSYLPDGRRLVEIRLLSIQPKARSGKVLAGLLNLLIDINRSKNWDMALISGTTRQQKLYRHIGFQPFGPLVGSEEARYQPMSISLDDFQQHTRSTLRHTARTVEHRFLPGPVQVTTAVRQAFESEPLSHRSAEFLDNYQQCRHRLCQLVNSQHTMIAMGTGTLANEMVAAHLSGLGGIGLVLSNGEFGERLIDHCLRFDLEFASCINDWGEPFDIEQIPEGRFEWLWMTACETSTGMRNDYTTIAAYCQAHGIKLCIDAVSAVGAYPVDFSAAYLATTSSGKAIAAYPGLAIVFANHPIQPTPCIPRYLDLHLYQADSSVPFTFSSNVINALLAALQNLEHPDLAFAETERLSAELRRSLPLAPIVDADQSSPAVLTISVPDKLNSRDFAKRLRERFGIEVASESTYLVERNWIQICLMGQLSEHSIKHLIESIDSLLLSIGMGAV